MQTWRTLTDRSLKILSILFAAALPFLGVPFAHAAIGGLNNRYDKLSDSTISAVATHQIGFTYTNTTVPVGSISIQFCSNDPLPNTPCIAPSGFDATAVALASQSGETGFSVDPGSTANRIVLTRPAAVPASVASRYTLTNLINPSYVGTFYARLQTYTSTDATGSDIEASGVALSTTRSLTIQSEVPPYLKFCTAVTIVAYDCSTANSYLIDMGEFRATQTTNASTEFVVATNAGSGYSVTVSGNTLTSGNNIITPLSTGGVSNVGASQFGMNLAVNSNPAIGATPVGPGVGTVSSLYNNPNVFRFQNGDTLVSSVGSSDNQKFTVSYITNVNNSQPPGYYATTLTYICLANF